MDDAEALDADAELKSAAQPDISSSSSASKQTALAPSPGTIQFTVGTK